MNKKPDNGFCDFISKEYPNLGNNPMGWTFEDERWTDYQAYHLAKEAYAAGLKAGLQVDRILLGAEE